MVWLHHNHQGPQFHLSSALPSSIHGSTSWPMKAAPNLTITSAFLPGGKKKKKSISSPLRTLLETCIYQICLYPIGQNLRSWADLTAK